METSTRVIVLFIIYGLPVLLAIVYRINKNIMLKRNTITENEILGILREELPEINSELKTILGANTIYKTLKGFANYTKKCATTKNVGKLKTCFIVADKLISKGNDKVKSGVRNVYLISIASLFEVASPIQNHVKKMLPESLKNAYQKQIMAHYP